MCSSLSGSRAVSTQSTATPAWRNEAAGAARPSGWRPRSYVEMRRARTSSLFHVILADDAADLLLGGATRYRLLRTPARPLDALLYRDVGALQLLRDARL